MKMPRVGSAAKECTETSTPERTRNVPEQAQREREHRQQQRPALEQAALVRDGQRVNQRGAHQPRHERGILDRIPEPVAAPAQLVVGPPAAERDARQSGMPRRRSSTAGSSVPTSGPCVLRASPRTRMRTPPRSRRNPCTGWADEWRARGPAGSDSGRVRPAPADPAAETDSTWPV